jgi:hypothetical protein
VIWKVKTIIVTALSVEAKPIISHFRLRKNSSSNGMEYFENDAMLLVCSGVGKVRAAAAAVFALDRVSLHSAMTIFNIGIAGASRHGGFSVGTPLVIHKIIDRASGREFFPDMLTDTGLLETHLTTVDRPVISDTAGMFPTGVVDMEGSGFFEAAGMFVQPHQIACMKIVSDYFETGMISKKRVEDLIEEALPSLDRAVAAYRSCDEIFSPMLHEEAAAWAETVSNTLLLTVSQRVQLNQWLSCRFDSEKKFTPPFIDSILSPPVNKQERNRRLAEIKQLLMSY